MSKLYRDRARCRSLIRPPSSSPPASVAGPKRQRRASFGLEVRGMPSRRRINELVGRTGSVLEVVVVVLPVMTATVGSAATTAAADDVPADAEAEMEELEEEEVVEPCWGRDAHNMRGLAKGTFSKPVIFKSAHFIIITVFVSESVWIVEFYMYVCIYFL